MAELKKQTLIKYSSIYSGKQESYILSSDEILTDSRCPIDNSLLYAASRGSGRDVWESVTMYCCPNCREEYYHREPEKLQRSKQLRVEERKKDLAKLKVQEDYLLKFLRAAGERV